MDDASSESRDDVLHVPNLYDYFCSRTAQDALARGGTAGEPPATGFAGLILTLLAAFAFWVFGLPGLSKATFVLFGALMLWTVWGVVIRSTEQVSQKADSIKAGVFPPTAAPFVIARLKWWNHLLAPQRWGRHSRLFERRGRLERRIAEMNKTIAGLTEGAAQATYAPPSAEEVAQLAESLRTVANRHSFELKLGAVEDKLEKARAELVLYMALLHKLDDMGDRLDRIEKLTVVFHTVNPNDLSQIVGEAIQVLEERRLLVLGVDQIDPDDFVDLVTVRSM